MTPDTADKKTCCHNHRAHCRWKYLLAFILVVIACVLFKYKTTKTRQHAAAVQQMQDEQALAKLHDQIALNLKVMDAEDENGPLKLVRIGSDNDGGYVAPLAALHVADALLGYGIADNASFEEDFATQFKKPAYGFDCGVNYQSNVQHFTFIPECIGNDQHVYTAQKSNQKTSTFETQLRTLHLEQKPIFIKMDIEGGEYSAFKNMLPDTQHITGIVLELHLFNKAMKEQAVQLLDALHKNFILVHVHGNNCAIDTGFYSKHAEGKIPAAIELTYINKNLVTHAKVSEGNQHHPLPLDMPNNKTIADTTFTIRRE